jgi:hypothetical protein
MFILGCFFMFVPCIFSLKILLLKSNWCTLLVASTLNKIKVTLNTATCFGSRRNHHQGVPQCLAKAIYMDFMHVDADVVNGMAAYQPAVPVCALCGGRMNTASTQYTYQHNRLICCHTMDCVTSDVHKNHIYGSSQALRDSLMMVPTWTETCWSIYCDFNFI